MRFLIDTHALVWTVEEPSRLSGPARDLLQDARSQSFVSAASIWEMSIKYKMGRWHEVMLFLDELRYAQVLDGLGAVELAITGRHGRLAGQFQSAHKDPFDRIIAAQAFLEGLSVISKDTRLDEFPITRIW